MTAARDSRTPARSPVAACNLQRHAVPAASPSVAMPRLQLACVLQRCAACVGFSAAGGCRLRMPALLLVAPCRACSLRAPFGGVPRVQPAAASFSPAGASAYLSRALPRLQLACLRRRAARAAGGCQLRAGGFQLFSPAGASRACSLRACGVPRVQPAAASFLPAAASSSRRRLPALLLVAPCRACSLRTGSGVPSVQPAAASFLLAAASSSRRRLPALLLVAPCRACSVPAAACRACSLRLPASCLRLPALLPGGCQRFSQSHLAALSACVRPAAASHVCSFSASSGRQRFSPATASASVSDTLPRL